MEPQFRILRRTDCIRPAEREYLAHLRHTWCRPTQSQLLLDTTTTHGHPRATHHRHAERPYMVSLRQTHTIPLRRRIGSRSRDVPAAQRRLVRHGCERSHGVRPCLADVPRHEHQHGDAAVQDARGRHGQRATEVARLLHTVVPVQRRINRGLPLPLFLHSHRHSQRGAEGRDTRLGHLLVLHRCGDTHPLRHLHHTEGEGVEPAGVRRV